MRVRIFLRQSLFTLPGEGQHVPPTASILDGTLGEATPLGVAIKVERFLDERGRPVEGKPCTLIIPGAKIDHVWVQE
ncbi:MAG: hypothetical protein Q8P41_24230 [Pseudomonadota bacterium]|nr:hypothetical protein [Pseudomonadota bacterium]